MRDLSLALDDRPGALAEMGEVLGRAKIGLLLFVLSLQRGHAFSGERQSGFQIRRIDEFNRKGMFIVNKYADQPRVAKMCFQRCDFLGHGRYFAR